MQYWVNKWVSEDYKFDAFCVGCERSSIFSSFGDADAKKIISYSPPPVTLGARQGAHSRPEIAIAPYSRTFFCFRDRSHRITVHLQINAKTIEKIGQYPSIASMAQPELQKFKKLLGVERLQEMKKAYGLFSHGVGAGSLIYLRRVLERIVELARAEMSATEGEVPSDFDEKRFEEKLRLLKAFVPEAFYANRKLYALISAGLHALTEKDCLDIFPVAAHGIDLALSAVQARNEQAEKAATVTRAVATKADEIKRLTERALNKGAAVYSSHQA